MEIITQRTSVEGWDAIIRTFEELGFGKVDFGDGFEKAYRKFHWVLMPHPIAKVRFYAIPANEDLLTLPWDSWYFLHGEPVHHVHYAQQYDNSWSEWIQPVPAPECPEELVGIPWYWYNERHVTPSILLITM